MPSGRRWNVQQQFEAAARYTPPVAKRYLVNDPWRSSASCSIIPTGCSCFGTS